jgi:hypothetical protein
MFNNLILFYNVYQAYLNTFNKGCLFIEGISNCTNVYYKVFKLFKLFSFNIVYVFYKFVV